MPWKLQHMPASDGNTLAGSTTQDAVYQRYYHLFKGGELRQLVVEGARECGCLNTLSVDEEIWEQGNWCVRAEFVRSGTQ